MRVSAGILLAELTAVISWKMAYLLNLFLNLLVTFLMIDFESYSHAFS
jgi:hypothetical protein